jgi:hypothetical protein
VEPRLPVVDCDPNSEQLLVPELAPAPEPMPAAELAAQATDFQAMTKAQIVEHCHSAYGVELDGSQTKAELVEQAGALELQTAAEAGTSEPAEMEPRSCEPLPDELLDDPLI